MAFAASLPSLSAPTLAPSSDSSSSATDEEVSPKIPSSRMPAVLSVLVPGLLARAAAEGKPLFKEIAHQILQLASADQMAFRGVVAKMDGEKRAFMEEIIRQGGPSGGAGGAGRRPGERDGAGEPSIALKLNFGGS